MPSAAELKRTFQDGWNIPARVDNYVRNVAEGEFRPGESLQAWRGCLENALSATGRLKILDVGTGPGVFACLYAQMGHECTGLDFSQRMLGEARRRRGVGAGLLVCLRRRGGAAVSGRGVRRGLQPALAFQPAAARRGRPAVGANSETRRKADPDRRRARRTAGRVAWRSRPPRPGLVVGALARLGASRLEAHRRLPQGGLAVSAVPAWRRGHPGRHGGGGTRGDSLHSDGRHFLRPAKEVLLAEKAAMVRRPAFHSRGSQAVTVLTGWPKRPVMSCENHLIDAP